MKNNLPDIHYFNPTCEYAVANGNASWQPNRLLQKMEADLETLPLYFSTPEDVVLVRKAPASAFLDSLDKLSIQAPHFESLHHFSANKAFIEKAKNRLKPWGWSPAVHKLLQPLKPFCSEQFKKSPVSIWRPEYREIYSKKFALDILKQVLPLLPAGQVIEPGMIAKVCTTKQEIEELIKRWGQLMVKAPWSSSGRGLQPVTKTPVVPKVWEKLLGMVKEQGCVIVEPLLPKVMDMSLQFEITFKSIRYVGISRFMTDQKGQYQGNYLNGWPETFDKQEIIFAEMMAGQLAPILAQVLEKSKLAECYEGNFGVDTLIYKDPQGILRINPCLEINVRQNMGLLSLTLEKILPPNVKGIYRTWFDKSSNFLTFSEAMTKQHPAHFGTGSLMSGYFALTPANHNTLFGAYLMV